MTNSTALRTFYRLKPLLPRRAQIAARRFRARRIWHQHGCDPCAALPTERLAYRWPQDGRACVLLTHDVELAEGQARVDALAQLEEARGLRSCWNFVVQRYAVDTGLVADLQARGHEVGIHGVYHDGKLFASEAGFRKRLAIMVDAAERWGANGFRSPSLIYERTMLEQLPFRWDSSMPSWDPFQPKPGDCRRFVPFALNDQCIELPVTLWQDFTLFEELRFRDIEIWRQQVTRLYECGALINVIVHPDYMLTAGRVGLYTELLDLVQAHRDIVSTTPAALAQWHLRTDGSASGTELE